MNITDKISELIDKHGIVQLTFAKTKDGGLPVVVANQVIRTERGQSSSEHHSVGSSFADALENVTKTVAHCAEMQSKILRVHEPSN